jgi:uncharacterized membrane protein YfcA
MKISLGFVAILVVTGSIASYLRARVTVKKVPSSALNKIFGIVIVVMTLYRLLSFFI